MRKKKPINYGVTKKKYHDLLKKASKPVKKEKSDSKKP